MPLVVVTTAETKRHSAEAEKQAGQVLEIANRVVDGLGDRFVSDSWEVFEGFSDEALAGEPVRHGRGPARPSSFVVRPANVGTLPGAALEPETALHQHHCLAISGTFRIDPLNPVPARLEVNLYRQWAKEQGDITLETFKTHDVKADGLYELIDASGETGLDFAERLGKHIGSLNHEIDSGPRIRWASVKDVEGTEEPSGGYVFLYRLDDMRTSRLIQNELTKVAEEEGREIYRSASLRSAPYYRKTVEDMISELSSFPLFAKAAERVGAEEGLIRVETGSVLFVDRKRGASGRAAKRILDAVGEDFRSELRRRIGAAQSWPDSLSKLVGAAP